ncbi:MAG: hypothetical protein MUC29_07550 [Pyrinomonadaceae bacterium]|jgi:hypothetical protein|nr:hypothetical protein [Pyrinomonadaceae bacterium]
MKKTILTIIASILLMANLAFGQTTWSPADFDPTFGSTSPGITFEPLDRVIDVEVNRWNEILVLSGWGLKIYDGDGNLDRSIPNIGPANSFTMSRFIKISNDSDIIVGGQISVNGVWERFLTKLDTNLNVIRTFGNNGFVIVPPKTINHQTNAMTLQKDGKIILVGQTYEDWNVLQTHRQFTTRFNQDGSIDRTFGIRGTIYESINNNLTTGTSVDMQGENIVVAGTHLYGGSHLVVYDKNGSREPGFNNGNILIGLGHTVAVQNDYKIVVSASFNSYDLSIARLNIDGTYDQSFGRYQPYGIVTNSILPYHAVTIRKIGFNERKEIVVAGDFDSRSFIARYAFPGYLDQNFRTSSQQPIYMPTGTNLLDFGAFSNTDTITAFSFQGNKIIVGSGRFGNGVFGSMLSRLNG